MDTNNLDKWWYGLPENTRQAIGNDEIWEKLDMPSRSALHRYSLLRIYGTAKDRDEERWKSHSTLTLLATQNYPFLLKYDCPLWLK